MSQHIFSSLRETKQKKHIDKKFDQLMAIYNSAMSNKFPLKKY